MACERPVNRVAHGLSMPAQTFEHVERLPLDVSYVEIIRGDGLALGRSGDFSISLHERAMLYLSQKLYARGFGVGHLVAVIDEANVSHVQKASSHSVLSRIGVDRVDEYVLTLVVRFEHSDAVGQVLSGEVLRVEKRFSVSEHDSLAGREQKKFKAVEDIFKVLDPRVGRVIKGKMHL